MKKCYLLLMVLFLISCNKNELEQYGKLAGTVKDSFGNVIEGAKIKIPSFSNYTSITNSRGEFIIDKIPVNNYQIEVSKNGYISLSLKVSIIANKIISNNYILNIGTPTLSISENLINISPGSGHKIISVNSNTSWTIINPNSWLTCSIDSGNGEKSLTINWQENTLSSIRTGIIEFSAGEMSKKLTITQDFQLKLIKYSSSNGKAKLNDSLFIIFNRPIKVNSLLSGTDLYYLDSGISYFNDSCGFKFSSKYMKLGGSYPIVYSVTDDNGTILSGEINISLFTQKVEFNGVITDFLITPDNQRCWVTVKNPNSQFNRLFLLSLEDLKILKEFNLEFPPNKMHLNIFNNKLYITGGDIRFYIWDPNIYIFDLNTEKIEKIITVNPHSDDPLGYPSIYPVEICFTNTGYGIISTIAKEGSGGIGNYDVINWSLGDSIYPLENEILDISKRYDLTPNFNYTKIFLTNDYGDCTIRAIDGNSHELTTIIPPYNPIDLLGEIVANRNSNKIFISAHDEQYILNLDNNQIIGKGITRIGRGGISDFSYKQGEDNFIYLLDGLDYFFWFLDYNNSNVLIKYPLMHDLGFSDCGNIHLKSTTDGNFVIENECGLLYLFNTEMFSIN